MYEDETPLVQYTSQPTPPEKPKKSRKGLKITGIIFLVLLLLGASGFSVYTWMQNTQLKTDLSSRDGKIDDLNKQVTKLTADNKTASQTQQTDTTGNTLKITELGISIALPDAAKDATYSYTGKTSASGVDRSTVTLSTKTLTDLDTACSSFSTAPALGELTKVTGQYPKDTTGPASTFLVKQFSGYYVAYGSPQSTCSAKQPTSFTDTLLKFKTALSSVKELN
jgi:hypothetical protein